MAFNFNWSPLAASSSSEKGGADASSSAAFYSHAKELLTAALNKSTKPPIIVDDIFVEDLNLGQTAPDLEILEIGDLAEDRFRGIFRMSYAGEAELTLKTKVQANPLNTYLSTAPSYTSPDPLAATSPLTIPLQITLSQFRLSGFVILVFSKAKGITLVFRNDPLESLKVSSTFDSIPFIKEYLQKEIERQVRGLFQEELPVAVHRLSLRLWNPEYAASLGLDSASPAATAAAATPEYGADDVADAEDAFFNPLLAPTDSGDAPSTVFSQKNMLRLAALVDSQRTLSVFTPGIRDAVFRAWASGTTPAAGTVWDRTASAATSPEEHPSHLVRPSLSTTASTMSLPVSPGRAHTPANRRKRKHRVVNLRGDGGSSKATSQTSSEAGSSYPATPSTSDARSETASVPPSVVVQGPASAIRDKRATSIDEGAPPTGSLKKEGKQPERMVPVALFASDADRPSSPTESIATSIATENITYHPSTAPQSSSATSAAAEKKRAAAAEKAKQKEAERERERRPERPQFRAGAKYASSIVEKAFMMKLAGEMQRRLEEERCRRLGKQSERWGVERALDDALDGVGEDEREAPPAYT